MAPAPPAHENQSEGVPYTRVMAGLVGAVFALVLLGSGYYMLVSESRMVRLSEASRRVLQEHMALREQMDSLVASERTKAAALSTKLAEARDLNAKLERELLSARHLRPGGAPAFAVATTPNALPRAAIAPVNDTGTPPPTRPADKPEAACHPGDPLCSNL